MKSRWRQQSLIWLLLGSIPLGQRCLPGWGGLCVSSTNSSLPRFMRNVPLWGEHAQCRTKSSNVGAGCTNALTALIADFTSVSMSDCHSFLEPSVATEMLPPTYWMGDTFREVNKDAWLPQACQGVTSASLATFFLPWQTLIHLTRHCPGTTSPGEPSFPAFQALWHCTSHMTSTQEFEVLPAQLAGKPVLILSESPTPNYCFATK